MKNFKIILLSIIGLFITSCDLDEDPIFLDSNAVYSDISVAKGALDGIYQALTSYNAQERRIFAINGFSGLFTAGKEGFIWSHLRSEVMRMREYKFFELSKKNLKDKE